MSNKKVLFDSGTVIGLIFAGVSAAAAQSTDARTGSTTTVSGLEEVTVTARRVEENQQRVPVAVTTLNAAALERRNIEAVTDIQFSVPNLQIKPSSLYPGASEFIIRGQRQQLFTDENVVTYVNGIPQSTRGLTLYDLDSVQALKGPQGTLFGKSSLGGAMVFTTKRPVFDFEGMAELEYGNYDRKTATAMLNLPIVADKVALRLAGNIQQREGVYENSFPGAEDLANLDNESARATLLLVPSDSIESQTTFDYLHRDEIGAPDIVEAAPLSATGFAALVSLLTQQGVTQQSAAGGSAPISSDGLLIRRGTPFRTDRPTGIGTTTPDFVNPATAPLNTTGTFLRTYGAANTTTFSLNDSLKLRNIFGYRYESAIDEQDPNGIGGFTLNVSPFISALGVPGLPAFVPGLVVNNSTNFRNKSDTYTEEVQLIASLETLDLIVGGFYSDQELDQAVVSHFTVGPVVLYPFLSHFREGEIKTTSKALFAQGTYDFSNAGADGLRLTLGARYNWDKKSMVATDFYSDSVALHQSYPAPNTLCQINNGTGLSASGVNSATVCEMNGSESWKALTWTASLEYQLTPDTLVYFANRRGYKSGGTTPTSSVNLDYNFYDPEKLTDFELGLKHQGLLGSIPYRVNIAGFIGKYEDIQTQDIISFCVDPTCPGAAPANYTDLLIFNVGKATIKGVEAELSVKPAPILTVDAAYSYQVGRYGNGSVIPQPTVRNLPVGNNNPIDFTTGVDISDIEFPGVPRQTFNTAATLEMPFIPDRFAKTTLSMNYAYRTDQKGLITAGVYNSPGFGILGGRLEFQDVFETKLSLALWGQNLADKQYKLYCADNLNSIGYASCKWGEPRTYGATASFKF